MQQEQIDMNQSQIIWSQAELAQYSALKEQYPFEDLQSTALDATKLKKYRMSIINPESNLLEPSSIRQVSFRIVQTRFHGLEYEYQVVLGPYKFNILMLNRPRLSFFSLRKGQVGLSSIQYSYSRNNQPKNQSYNVIKLTYRQKYPNPINQETPQKQLEICLREYCFYKLFSFFSIGPRILLEGYELVCYKDGLQFMTQPFSEKQKQIGWMMINYNVDEQQCERKLFKKLLLMHSMKIVHGRINPLYMSYSQERKEFILEDYSMTKFQWEIGSSQLDQIGTPFSDTCHQVKQYCYCGQKQKKDLNIYMRDVRSLQKLVNSLKKNNKIYVESRDPQDYWSAYYQKVVMERKNQLGYFQKKDFRPEGREYNMYSTNYQYTSSNTDYLKLQHTEVNYYVSTTIGNILTALILKTQIAAAAVFTSMKSQLNKLNLQTNYVEYAKNQIQSVVDGLNQEQESVTTLINQWTYSCRHRPSNDPIIKQLLDKAIEGVKGVGAKNNKIQQINFPQYQEEIMTQIEFYKVLNDEVKLFLTFQQFLFERQLPQKGKSRQGETKQQIFVAETYFYAYFKLIESPLRSQRLGQELQYYLIERDQEFKQEHYHSYKQNRRNRTLFWCFNLLNSQGKLGLINKIRYFNYTISLETLQGKFQLNLPFVFEETKKLFDLTDKMNLQQIQQFLKYIFNIINFREKMKHFIQIELCEEAVFRIYQENINKYKLEQNQEILQIICARAEILWLKKQYSECLKEHQIIMEKIDDKRFAHNEKIVIQIIKARNRMGALELYLKDQQSALIYFQKGVQLVESYTLPQHSVEYCSVEFEKVHIDLRQNLIIAYLSDDNVESALQQMDKLEDLFSKNTKHDSLGMIRKTSRFCIDKMLKLHLKSSCEDTIKKMISRIVEKTCQKWLRQQSINDGQPFLIVSLGSQEYLQKDVAFIYQVIIDKIKEKSTFKRLFHHQYANSHYQLGKYYTHSKKLRIQGLKYIWKYLEIKFKNVPLTRLESTDFQIIRIYTQCLINSHSNRMAVRFLDKFIKRVPNQEEKLKIKLFELMYKAMQVINHPQLPFYQELTKKNCKYVKNYEFGNIVSRVGKGMLGKRLINKQLKLLFFINLGSSWDRKDSYLNLQ